MLKAGPPEALRAGPIEMMFDVQPSVTDWMTAIGTVATAVATFGLVVVAAVTFGGARRQLRLLREQLDRESRPYVFADVVPGLHGAGNWDLIITNLGKSTAYGVQVRATVEPQDADDHIAGPLNDYLNEARVLVPGARHRVMWRMEAEGRHRAAGAAARTEAALVYTDAGGARFSEDYVWDVDVLGAASPVPTEGPRSTSANAELGNIERAIRSLSVHVGELRR